MNEFESGSSVEDRIFRTADDVVSRRVGDVVVLVGLRTNRIYELNATGARMWELLRDGAGMESLAEQLSREFDVQPGVLDAEIKELLNQLHTEGLVL